MTVVGFCFFVCMFSPNGGGGGGCCYTDKELIIAEHQALVFLHVSVCSDTAQTTPVPCEYILKRIKATKNQEASLTLFP